ncbi:MAG: hypothetical protein MK008_04895 [Bdellovibrionales bacterium]|nr:hypothetical protein [Bdellovibrionales bacterium]
MIKKILILLLMSSSLYAKDINLNITDLGFDEDKEQNPELSKILEEREYYLKQHQIWGLVSATTMVLAVFSGGEGNLPPEHAFFAGLAATSYAASAYTAWKAPEINNKKLKGGSLWHRRLAWLHVPGMFLTPILGYLAAQKINKGKELSGVEKYHKDVAGVTAAALMLSALSVSFEF